LQPTHQILGDTAPWLHVSPTLVTALRVQLF